MLLVANKLTTPVNVIKFDFTWSYETSTFNSDMYIFPGLEILHFKTYKSLHKP